MKKFWYAKENFLSDETLELIHEGTVLYMEQEKLPKKFQIVVINNEFPFMWEEVPMIGIVGGIG